MQIGVCYYPEHWPEETWRADAERMRDIGIHWVRIGEFAWSRLEPTEGTYDFDWLDRAIDALGDAGLRVVLGTPTATPPKWLLDAYPDVIPYDVHGRPRGFGSRRHYSFNSPSYWRESKRIVMMLARRYGHHDAVGAWQIDNEFGCHDTVRSYGPHDLEAFRRWLELRYETVERLNEAWWNVFWSMEYRSFDEVELPNLTVTEANPSHSLDFQRFSSDAVVAYNRMQAAILAEASPQRLLIHNSMAFFGEYDHFKLAEDLDVIAWDNYPLGMLETSPVPDALKERYARTGHPDLIGYTHDLYRGLKGRAFWVMEQQPGQVNWAPSNPLPERGAVRLWSHQAFAHGAEVVSYFRWRAANGAQELMHAGLNRHDGTPDRATGEARTVREEIAGRADGAAGDDPQPRVALLLDYEDMWATDGQPHAAGWRYWALQIAYYGVLRSLGVDVAITHPARDLSPYALVLAPALHLVDEARAAHLGAFVEAGGTLVLGPRSGAKTISNLVQSSAPGPLAELAGVRHVGVDALRPGLEGRLRLGDREFAYHTWADLLEVGTATARATYSTSAYSGDVAIAERRHGSGACFTIGAWGTEELHAAFFTPILRDLGIAIVPMPDGLRVSRRGDRTYLMNFRSEAVPLEGDLTPFGDRIGAVDVLQR